MTKLKSKAHSPYTPHKQKQLIRILNSTFDTLTPTTPFVWIDTTGGLPKWDIPKFGGCVGSTVIGHTIFEKHAFYESIIFEHEAPHFDALEAVFDHDERVKLYCTDNKRAAKLLGATHAKTRGLVYFDPEGSPELGTPIAIGKAVKNMDVLCHINAAGIKRCEGKKAKGQDVNPAFLVTINDLTEQLGRKYNFITPCRERQQWCFVYSTDNEAFVPPSGMLDITSKEGKIMFDYACYAKADIETEEDGSEDLKTFLDSPEKWRS